MQEDKGKDAHYHYSLGKKESKTTMRYHYTSLEMEKISWQCQVLGVEQLAPYTLLVGMQMVLPLWKTVQQLVIK